MSPRLTGVLSLVALFLASGCAEEPALVFVVDSDLRVDSQVDHLRVEVVGSAEEDPRLCAPAWREFRLWSQGDFPFVFVVEQGSTYGVWVAVRVRGTRADDVVVTTVSGRRHFPESSFEEVSIELTGSCHEVACGPDEVCVGGSCRPNAEVGLFEDPTLHYGNPLCDASVPLRED